MPYSAVTPPIWRPLRLETLVRLRWLAVIGQAAGIFVVAGILGFPLPVVACMVLIVASILFNLYLGARFGAGYRLTNNVAAGHLAFDLMQLGGLLWLTGGLENPFYLLLLAPVAVAATTLARSTALVLCGLAAIIASVLAGNHLPLPWSPETQLQFNNLYLTGIWISLLLGIVFTATYTNRVAHEARQLADAAAATELTLARQQRLSALDGLAAAAAHELGTPLSTIALAAKEMRAELPEGHLAEDADLIVEQAARCRAILTKLRSLDNEQAGPFGKVLLTELVAEVGKPHETAGKAIRISKGDRQGEEPLVRRNVGLLYGLGNLIENATHFARTAVEIEVGWDEAGRIITITDDGDGFPPELVSRLGEPYLTTRLHQEGDDPSEMGGLGLGIFIAKSLLERTGAEIRFSNARQRGHARVEIRWPASAFDA